MVMFDELADWLVGPRQLWFQLDESATALVLIAGSAAWLRGPRRLPFWSMDLQRVWFWALGPQGLPFWWIGTHGLYFIRWLLGWWECGDFGFGQWVCGSFCLV